jgi:hypothetical protein
MKTTCRFFLLLLALFTVTTNLPAQGTAFTYQGRLNDNANPACGNYDFTFGVWNAANGPAQVGDTLTNANTVVSNGLFSVTLDFGVGIFTGANRWLEIAVRTNNVGDFTTLLPRQAILPAPYAITAATAGNLSGTLSAMQISGSLPVTQITGTLPLAQLPGAVVTNNASGVILNGSFSGNGAGVTNLSGLVVWQAVSGNKQQAKSNMGYLVTDASQTTITLPTAPSVGDIVRVGGEGAGGWTIAQNAGQSVQAGAFGVCITNMINLSNWVERTGAGGGPWHGVASSSNGTKLVACQYGGYIYTSADSGTNWTLRSGAGGGPWYGVASSSDGTKLVAGQYGGYIYTSADSGASWTLRSGAGVGAWYGVASSSDGTKLVACRYGGYICTAAGATYTTTTPGIDGSVTGNANAAIELIYVGTGQFVPLSSLGTLIWQ